MERTIISSLIGAILALGGWIIGTRSKVSVVECKTNRDEIARAHAAFCPENRSVLTKIDHDKLCDLTIHPMRKELEAVGVQVRAVDAKLDEIFVYLRDKK